MSTPEKENLNGELGETSAELNEVPANEEQAAEVPSDEFLPEIPSEDMGEVIVENDDDDDEDDEPQKKAPVIVLPDSKEAAESKTDAKRRAAAEAEKKKKRNSLIWKICLPLIALFFIGLAIFESNILYRFIPAIKVSDTTYSVAEFNYFYTNSFSDAYSTLQQTYGDYVKYFLDPEKPLKEQQYSETQTWEDYTKESAIGTIRNATALYQAGKAAGFEMSEQQKAEADAAITNVEMYSQYYGYSMDDYLIQLYGKGMSKDVYKKMVDMTYYASAYSQKRSDDEVVTPENITARYDENHNDFDTVTFRYFFINGAAAEGEDAAAAMKAAKDKADRLVKEGTTEEKFVALALELAADAEKEKYKNDDATIARDIGYSSVNTGYADWAFDTARKDGDTFVYEAPNGYYALRFVSRNDIHYNTANVRHALISPVKDATTGEITDAAKAEAKKKAEALYAEWQKGAKTEDSFAEMATANTEDAGSKANGGLYKNVAKGQMVQQFNDWCFDSARKTGDSGIVETDYGYHIMFYSGAGEDYFDMRISAAIKDERFKTWLDNELTNCVAAEQFGMKYACNR